MLKQSNQYNADAWGHQSILNFFDAHRLTTNQVYPSEWFFIGKHLHENIRILDIGCAKGGFANVLAEHLQQFTYVGVDINADMITAASARHPHHQFHVIEENNYAALNGQIFDLVLCLGILHLHETWRKTLELAWQHTSGSLIFDLRETYHASIEDKKLAYFRMDFDHIEQPQSDYILPYNIINHTEAAKTIHGICRPHNKLSVFGYTQKISALAVSPVQEVMANVYCADKKEMKK